MPFLPDKPTPSVAHAFHQTASWAQLFPETEPLVRMSAGRKAARLAAGAGSSSEAAGGT